MRQIVIQYKRMWHDGYVIPIRTSLIVENDQQIEDFLKADETYDRSYGYKIKTDYEITFPIILGHTTYWTE